MSRFSLPAAPRRARFTDHGSRLPSSFVVGPSSLPSSVVGRPSAELRPRDLLRLQRAYGNRAVQRLLDHDRPTLPAPTGGQPLPKSVAGQMQRAFDADLSHVRVSESPAVASLGARAVTQGSHIAFAPGELRPHTSDGQQLLGHELTHVLQQRRDLDNSPPSPVARSSPRGRGAGGVGAGAARLALSPALEAEADRLGALAAQGQRVPQPSAAPGGPQPMLVGEVVALAATAGIAVGTLLAWAWDRGWAYALGETQKESEKETSESEASETEGLPAFTGSIAEHKEAFIQAVITRSQGQMDRAAAEALYQQEVRSDLEAIDEVTGFAGAAHRVPTLNNALNYVRTNQGAAAFYVEADVRNLGGLNAHLGTSGANLVYRQLAQTAERHLRRLPGEVHPFRHGGDEVSFVIVGQQGSLTAASIAAALQAADEENATYASSYTFLSIAPYARNKRLAIADIPHIKYSGKSGTGLIWALAQALPEASGADDVISAADQLVEARKKQAGEFSAPEPLYTQPSTEGAPSKDDANTTTTSTLVKLAWSAGIEMTSLVRWAWDKGWEYAYDQVLKYSSVGAASVAYLASAEQQKEEFIRAAVSLSFGKLSRADALALYDKDVRAFVEARDVVTGFQGARHRGPTVRNALEYVRQNPDTRAYYVEANVRNLSGLNAHLGHNNTDVVYQRLAKTAEERLRGLPGQSFAFRLSGGKICFVVVGHKDDLTQVEVETALGDAARDIQAYSASAAFTSIAPDSKGQRLKLKDVPHPRYKQRKGTGLLHAVAEIAPTLKDYNDVLRTAQALIESRRLGID